MNGYWLGSLNSSTGPSATTRDKKGFISWLTLWWPWKLFTINRKPIATSPLWHFIGNQTAVIHFHQTLFLLHESRRLWWIFCETTIFISISEKYVFRQPCCYSLELEWTSKLFESTVLWIYFFRVSAEKLMNHTERLWCLIGNGRMLTLSFWFCGSTAVSLDVASIQAASFWDDTMWNGSGFH